MWRAEGADAKALFDLQHATRLPGHAGPVTTVAIDDTLRSPGPLVRCAPRAPCLHG